MKKTDPSDVRNLAQYRAKDRLPEGRMKAKTEAQIASLTPTRDPRVTLRTARKNKLLAAHGIHRAKEARASEKALAGVLEMRFEELVELELPGMGEPIRGLNRSIEKLGASLLLSGMGDLDDFADEGKLAAYCGLVPRVPHSNETERSGRIPPRGTKLRRTTLGQCALVAPRYSPDLARYYDQIKSRPGGGQAIIAWARKFLGIIYGTGGDTPWTPGPLSLPSQVPERSSPSSVRSGKAFPTRQRFSSAAQKARALDGSGPFPRLPEIRASRHMQSSLAAGSCHPLVGPELFKKLGVDETS